MLQYYISVIAMCRYFQDMAAIFFLTKSVV